MGWRVGVWLSGLWPEETPPTSRLAVPLGQAEKLGYGAETKRQVGYGYDTFVMSSRPARNGETAALHVERANSADEVSTGRRR